MWREAMTLNVLYARYHVTVLQSGLSGCHSWNREILSNSQVCCLAQLCMATALFFSFSCATSTPSTLYTFYRNWVLNKSDFCRIFTRNRKTRIRPALQPQQNHHPPHDEEGARSLLLRRGDRIKSLLPHSEKAAATRSRDNALENWSSHASDLWNVGSIGMHVGTEHSLWIQS